MGLWLIREVLHELGYFESFRTNHIYGDVVWIKDLNRGNLEVVVGLLLAAQYLSHEIQSAELLWSEEQLG